VICQECFRTNIDENVKNPDIKYNKNISINTNQKVLPIVTPNVNIIPANAKNRNPSVTINPKIFIFPDIFAENNALRFEYEKLKKYNQELIEANIKLKAENGVLHQELFNSEYDHENTTHITSRFIKS
jgi:hypothetical protein